MSAMTACDSFSRDPYTENSRQAVAATSGLRANAISCRSP